jgi:hypothetical protein
MNCEEARTLFSGKAGGRLTQDEHVALTGHLDVCPVCPREWDRYLNTLIPPRSVEEPQAPPGSAERVIQAAIREPWYRRLLRAEFLPLHIKLPLAAVAVVAVSILVVLLFRQNPDVQRAAAPPPAQVAPAPATPSPAPPQEASGDKGLAKGREAATAPERRVERDRAESRESRAPAAAAPSLSTAQALSQVSGLLRPKNRDALDRQLEDLARQVSGTLVIDTSGARSGSVVEFVVARDDYAKLETGLHQIGDFRVEAKAQSLPEEVRVRIRIQ